VVELVRVQQITSVKNQRVSQARRLLRVILATQEAAIRRIVV
jgi:hypothetical protein